ncbi:MAG: relaxase/mobilization nuclease domain-containing protein, partial [Aestuariivirga sp.]
KGGRPAAAGASRGARTGSPPSAEQIRQKLRATVSRSPEVMVKITGGGKGMLHIAKHMEYISRNGALPLENEHGETYQGMADLEEAKDDFRFMFEPLPAVSHRKEAYNFALSMPKGTDLPGLKNAAREFAAENFPNHQYFFALHEPGSDVREDPSDNPHVHIVVKMASKQGVRLNLRKADLQRLRESFAQMLMQNGIRANATKRQARGQNVRTRKAPILHLEQQQADKGRAPRNTFASGPQLLTPRSQATQSQVWVNYEQIARALSHSPEAADRELAGGIVQFIKSTPRYQEQVHARDMNRMGDGERKRPGQALEAGSQKQPDVELTKGAPKRPKRPKR